MSLTGASGMWSDFNEANRSAMLKSELYSWPVTLVILTLAFGSLVAAGLPLMLTILGLLASAGLLALLSNGFEISIWAMNFALMFALALGIDYALFVVHRFRGAFFGSKLPARDAVAVTMDTAGKAVLFSGATVLISLSAVMLVPSPAFRSMALGIMLSVAFVLAATLTLLPAVLAKLGPRVDALPLRWVHSGEHRSALRPLGERLWRHPHIYGTAATLLLVLLALPPPWPQDRHALDQGRAGQRRLTHGLRAGAAGVRQRRAGRAADRRPARSERVPPPRPPAATPALRASQPLSRAATASCWCRRPRAPTRRARRSAAQSNGCAPRCRPGRSSAARWRRTTTSSRRLPGKTPLVIGFVLALGFLLLLVALQAPLIAALGVLTNLLAVGAAFGVGG